MDKTKYKKIVLTKKEAERQKDIIELLKRLDGTIIRKNPITGTLRLYVTKPKPNPNLSGKGVMLIGPNWSSGIYHK